MKRNSLQLHITIWLLMFIAIASFNRCYGQHQVIVYPGYTSYWNSETLIPDSVIYIAKPHKKIAARSSTFHNTGGRLNENADYHKSGYDQGHLCNASDENGNAIDEYNSFDQCNIYPQRPNCNRLTWLALENYVRKLAIQYGSVKVKVFWHGIAGHMGKDNVTIPTYCDKVIWYNGTYEFYSMPNSDTVNKHPFAYYKVILGRLLVKK